MKMDEYAYVRKFEEFATNLRSLCTKKFGEPDKIIIDTNIYLFLFEKGRFKLCVDSSESYCYPNDPDIYVRLIYTSRGGSFNTDELPPINIRLCNTLLKQCKKKINKAARIMWWPERTESWYKILVALTATVVLYIVGYTFKFFKWIKLWK